MSTGEKKTELYFAFKRCSLVIICNLYHGWKIVKIVQLMRLMIKVSKAMDSDRLWENKHTRYPTKLRLVGYRVGLCSDSGQNPSYREDLTIVFYDKLPMRKEVKIETLKRFMLIDVAARCPSYINFRCSISVAVLICHLKERRLIKQTQFVKTRANQTRFNYILCDGRLIVI